MTVIDQARPRVVAATSQVARGLDHALWWYLTSANRHEHWCRPAPPTGRPVVDWLLRGRTWLFSPDQLRGRPRV